MKAICDLSAPFGVPVAIDALNTPQSDNSISLTPDELTAVISRRAIPQLPQILMAHRTTVNDAFGEAEPLPGIGLTAALDPNISEDQLSILFLCLIPEGGGLCQYIRNSANDAFIPQSVGVSVSSHEFALANGLYATRNGRTIYYDSFGAGIVKATRSDPLASFGSVTQVPFALPFDSGSVLPFGPVITDDELTIFFELETDAGSQMWMATRTSSTQTFAGARQLSELTTPLGEAPSWVSLDGCRLYFSRVVPDAADGNQDFYVASHPTH